MQKVAFIILHYGSNRDTLECLESLSQVEVPKDTNVEIIVVDNGSRKKFIFDQPKNSLSKKRHAEQVGDKFSTNIKIIRNKENLGFAQGNNVGIKSALKNGADYVLILNNDTIVHRSLIEELLSVIKSDEKVGVVVPKIYFAKGFEFHKNRYKREELGHVLWYGGGEIDWRNVIGHHKGVDKVDRGQFDNSSETSFASGCCMMVKSEVFEKLGFFDEKYFLYYEDADLSERVKKAGYKIVYAPKAIIWHKNAGSAGGSGSKLQDYYITRNRLLFGMRYAPLRAKLALIKEGIVLLTKGRIWQKRGILDFSTGRFGKGSYPI